MYNPYPSMQQFGMPNTFNNSYQASSNKLPPQQIIKAKGKDSIDRIEMYPNCSALILDETAPIVWMCVSDGLGNASKIPYDISAHVEKPPVDMDTIENRIKQLEDTLEKIEVRLNDEPYDAELSKNTTDAEHSTYKKYGEYNA
ncbi:MAG: hypothetical protein IKN54_06135 [Lachnospiraceae bacterium]|nr:hypothetical protein [Lachnospiraceae bacterium]